VSHRRELAFGIVAMVLVIGYGVLGARVGPLLVPAGSPTPTPTKPVNTEVPAPQLPGKIAFSIRGDIYLLRDGRYINVSADGRSSQPNLSSDGQTLVFVRGESIDGKREVDGQVVPAVLNYSDVISRPVGSFAERIALTGLRQKAANGFHLVAFEDGPALSPDGKALAVIGASSTTADLEVYDAQRGTRLALLSQGAQLADPAWAPDGKTIAVTSYTLGSPRILLVAVDGSRAEPLKITGEGEPYRPAFSPDGAWLTYTLRHPKGGNDLHAVELETGRDVALTSDGRSWGGVFSPDGTHLVFLRDGGGVIDLWAMDLRATLTTGGTPAPAVRLTQGEGVDGDSRPSWGR
jgi:Tol biopolymer transport system component